MHNYMSMKDRIFMEGIDSERFTWYPGTYNFNGIMSPAANGADAGSSGTTNASVIGDGKAILTGTVGKGQIAWFSGFQMWANTPCKVMMDYGLKKCGFNGIVGPSGVYQTIDKMLFANDSLYTQLEGCVDASTTNKVVLTVSQNVFFASADMDYDAPYTMEVLGDSNTIGAFTGTGDQLWHWIVKRLYLQTYNTRIRIIDRSKGGQGTIHFEDYRRNNRLWLPTPPNITFYTLGTNDAATPISQLKTNVTNIINSRLQRNPAARIVLNSPLPKRNEMTQMRAIRTAYQEVAATFPAGKVIVVNNTDLFDPTTSTFFTPSNDGVHVNDVGHNMWAQNIMTTLAANDAIPGNTTFTKF